MLAEFKSPMHGHVELYEDRVVIIKGNAVGIPFSGKHNKTIYLNQLSGIDLKKGGLTQGHMHFSTGGSISKKGYSANVKDESTIIFGMQLNTSANKFKEQVESQISKNRSFQTNIVVASTPADEIAKFKELLDNGAITKEEYEQKKKELLGI